VADDTSIAPQQPPDLTPRDVAGLQALRDELVPLLDEMISSYVSPDVSDEVREHLEVLRVLLKAQAFSYLEHITSRTRLDTSTSAMYEDEVKAQAPLSTTLRGLVDAGTLDATQATRLAGYVSDRRTVLIFGDRATGKSTLLNALLELISVDERFVSIEQHDHRPALEERSFCVRLSVDDDTDLDSLFAKALKMQPSRIVIGEVHGDEILFLLNALKAHPEVGGFCTLRADSVHKAIAKLVRQMELHVSAADAKRLVGETRPVLVHLRSDEKGRPRLAAIWSVEGVDAGNEIVLSEQTMAGDRGGD
jgi:hypothetical protein